MKSSLFENPPKKKDERKGDSSFTGLELLGKMHENMMIAFIL